MSKKFKITIEYAEWLKEEDMWDVIDMHVFTQKERIKRRRLEMLSMK